MGKFVFNPFTGNLDTVLTGTEAATSIGGLFSAGSVLFSDGTIISEDNANLNWDDGQNYLFAFQFEGLQVVTAKVNEAGGITKGQVVYVSGATGDKPQAKLANNTLHDSSHILGVAAETKTSGQNIKIGIQGELIGFDTSHVSEGARAHVATGGAFQEAVVTSGAHLHIGRVTKSDAVDGILAISPNEYVHDIRATTDVDVKIATGADDGTRKIIFQDYSANDLGFMDGAGDFRWSGDVMVGSTDAPDEKIHVKTGDTTRIKIESTASLQAALVLKNAQNEWDLRVRDDGTFAVKSPTGIPILIDDADDHITFHSGTAEIAPEGLMKVTSTDSGFSSGLNRYYGLLMDMTRSGTTGTTIGRGVQITFNEEENNSARGATVFAATLNYTAGGSGNLYGMSAANFTIQNNTALNTTGTNSHTTASYAYSLRNSGSMTLNKVVALSTSISSGGPFSGSLTVDDIFGVSMGGSFGNGSGTITVNDTFAHLSANEFNIQPTDSTVTVNFANATNVFVERMLYGTQKSAFHIAASGSADGAQILYGKQGNASIGLVDGGDFVFNPALQTDAVATVAINAGGTSYVVDGIHTIDGGGGGSTARIQVTSVAAGVVTGLRIIDIGKDYTAGNGYATSQQSAQMGGNDDLTVDITVNASPGLKILGNLNLNDNDIINVGDIALDTISDDAGVERTLSIAHLNYFYYSTVTADGVTDDTAALEADITNAAGKAIVLPIGTIMVSAVDLLSNTHIVGQGKATILKLIDSSDTHVLVASNKDGIILENFMIDGNMSNQSAESNGVYCNPCTKTTIKNLWITAVRDFAIIALNSSDEISILNNKIWDTGVGNLARGIWYHQSTNGIISGNTVSNSSGFAYTIQESPHTIFTDNIGEDATQTDGIIIYDSDHTLVSNNAFKNLGDSGIVFELCNYCIAVGNTIEDANFVGLYLAGSSYCVVEGNNFIDNGQGANNTYSDITVQVSGATNSVFNIVQGNNIRATQANKSKYGIEEKDSSQDNNLYANNIINGPVTADTNILGANSLLTHYTGGNYGWGDDTPSTFASADVAGRIYKFKGTSEIVRLIVEGDPAVIDIVDSGGGADDKWVQQLVDGGLYTVQSILDSGLGAKTANIMASDLSNGNVGFGTATPATIASSAATSGRIVNLVGSGLARLAVQGTGVTLEMVDTGGGADDKWLQFYVNGGTATFSSINDAGIGVVSSNILVMDLGTGDVGLGKVPTQPLDVNGIALFNNKVAFTQADLNDYIDSHADGYIDIVGSTATRIGNAGNTTMLTIENDGDTYWTGAGTGLCYGSLYAHEAAINVDISGVGQGTYVKVTGLTAGLMNNVTENSDAFNVSKVGVYKVDWQISGDSQGTNKIYECDIFVNGVEQPDGSSRRKFGAAADDGSFSGTAIIDITNTGHDIDLRIEEPGAGAGTDIDLFHVNFNIVQVGGT